MYATHEELMNVEHTDQAAAASAGNATAAATAAPAATGGDTRIGLDRLEHLRDRLERLMDQIKGKAFVPTGAKAPPVFNQAQLAKLCKISPDIMSRRLARADELGLPAGQPVMRGATEEAEGVFTGRREWSLAQARQWIKYVSPPFKRAPGTPGCVVTTALFKGGVSKTITTASLAQGLTLKGYKVLCIDTDPQGSLTSLFGIMPTEVDESMTILPLFQDPSSAAELSSDATQEEIDSQPRKTIKQSIRQTYWDGLDLIAANRLLHSADFILPARQLRDRKFKFWDVINAALDDGTRMEYDFILIDTPPSLSYVAVNMLWAADGLLMPLPPEGLDLASSSQYWNMVTELMSELDYNRPENERKKFDFVGVLPTKVEGTPRAVAALSWINKGYEDLVLSCQIPSSEVVTVGGTEFRTVYDITKYVGSNKTYQRARDAFDELVKQIDLKARSTLWTRYQGASAGDTQSDA